MMLAKQQFKTLTFSLLCSTCVAATPTIKIDMLQQPQSIAQIIKIQQAMTMQEQPKQLAAHPSVICFQANIDQFLPKEITTPQPVYGCIFSDQVSMNAALLRAGLYIHTDMGMASDEQLYNSKLMTAVGGHDFAGNELSKYNANVVIPKDSKSEHTTYKNIENEFYTNVVRTLIAKHKDNFIFFAVTNTKKFQENLSHELLHAQYYNVPEIGAILETVWLRVPKTDQKTIIDCLRNGGYDMEQHELLLREFYSYFLQYNATEYLDSIQVLKPMAPLAKVYAPKIQAALAKHGIEVLTVTKKGIKHANSR